MIKFNIASINSCSEVEGPNKRLTIWFQGCNIHCPGCCNPDYQALIPRNIVSLEQLIEIIQDAKEKYDIEGVTYSGGEPTLQQNLPLLTQAIHQLDLSVISFTGRNYEEVTDILAGCDIVLDGAFIQEQRETKRKILGSTNQRILCINKKYQDYEKWFLNVAEKSLEININDYIIVNGDAL